MGLLKGNGNTNSNSNTLQGVVSTGRGGRGNIVRGREAQKVEEEDMVPLKERSVNKEPNQRISVGRGGAGNVSTVKEEDEAEIEDTIRKERSRSRGRLETNGLNPVFSIGRGGQGNMVVYKEEDDEEEGQSKRKERRGRDTVRVYDEDNRINASRSRSKSGKSKSGKFTLWNKVKNVFK